MSASVEQPVPSNNTGQHELQTYRSEHLKIIRMRVMGYGRQEIADRLGCSTKKVDYTCNSRIGKRKIRLLNAAADREAISVTEKLSELSQFALRVQEELMLDPNTKDKIRKEIASELLDRAGHKPEDKHVHAHLKSDHMQDIKERAEEHKKQATTIEDIEAEVVEEPSEPESAPAPSDPAIDSED